MYPLAHIRKLRRLIVKLGLLRPEEFDAASDEEVQRWYNGIGSSKYGNLVLGVSTWILSLYEAAALIHDYWWGAMNDGSRGRFNQSNSEFRSNCAKLAESTTLFFGWFRREARRLLVDVGHGLAAIVKTEDVGWPIWESGATIEPGEEVLA